MKRIIRTLLILCLITVISACVSQKRKEDVGTVGKFYHNTTAKFNGYFNANVLLTESIAKLNEQHQDNYNQILELYPYVAADNPQAVAGELDEAIKKSSVVVSLHRISHWTDDCYLLIGKAQFLKKSYEDAEQTLKYLRGEYSPEAMAAREALTKKGKKKRRKKSRSNSKKKKNKKKKSSSKKKKSSGKKKSTGSKEQAKKRKEYNKQVKAKKKARSKSRGSKKKKASKKKKDTKEETKEAVEKKEAKTGTTPKPTVVKNSKTKKDKSKASKEEDKQDNYFLKHRPAYQEGLLWLARTYIERENYSEAEYLMAQLERDVSTFDDIRSQLAPLRAYYYLRQKEYEQALEPLEKAIELAKKRSDKARYAYIIAQIHQQAGRGDQAFIAFERALKFSTSYEMEFSARLNMAMNGWRNGSASAEDTKKALLKMTKDIKNEEYLDQIYYALATIALKMDERKEGIKYLKQSLANSVGNSAQKAESYLQLADLYFEDQQYVEAKNYYDSTLQVMPNTDERHDKVTRFSNNLTDIAKNITIIMEQDSLLKIAALSDKDKKALAFQIQKEQEEKRLNDIKNAKNSSPSGSKRTNRSIRASSRTARVEASNFFAYNEKGVKKGRKDFKKRWGERKLEDNWRRSKRRGISGLDEEIVSEERIDLELTDDDIGKILKDVPQTPAQIKAAKKKIEDAMFKLGRLYRERLENNEKTVETLEKLLLEYPGTEHELEAWYYLYLAYTDLNNSAMAKVYFDKIIKKYPKTTYGRVLQDPNFLAASQEEERQLMIYYDQTYTSFTKGDYQDAFNRAAKAEEKFGPQHTMKAKFALLSAMCTGNLQGKEAYIKSLKDVVAKYPKTPEKKRAREILRILGSDTAGTGDDNKTKADGDASSRFKVEDKKVHYFIVVLEKGSIKLTDAKNAVSNYNRKYHKLDRLRISNIYFGAKTDTPILVIRRFKGKDLAMKYYDGIAKNKAEFLPAEAKYEYYPVTQYNYRQILKSKSMDGYAEFFEEYYR
ncbi:MAG: tetratricopeptide repeat protein [Bacteroidota bacterium]